MEQVPKSQEVRSASRKLGGGDIAPDALGNVFRLPAARVAPSSGLLAIVASSVPEDAFRRTLAAMQLRPD